jgi:hypothetical protein
MEVQKEELFACCKQIFLRQVAIAGIICITAVIVRKELSYSWIIGCIVAVFDTWLVLQGIFKGARKGPEEAVCYMQKTTFKRLFAVLVIVLVMLKLKLSVIGIFISFILLHIFLVLNLIIIARRNKSLKKGP